MSRVRKIRKIRKRKGGELSDPEERWNEGRVSKVGARWLFLILALVFGAALWSGTRPWLSSAPVGSREEEGAKIRGEIDGAEVVAGRFLAETDPEKRLHWVRDPGEVRVHLGAYAKAPLEEPGKIVKMVGHRGQGGAGRTGFVVELSSGELRQLEVVSTDDGLKVDWDAYARFGTVSWENLWSGEAEKAVVRVFCQPGTEHPEPFSDRSGWTCFQLSSPDMPQVALGFAPAGSVREAGMKEVILGTPGYRQQFVLEVKRHEGKDEPIFEITRCLAVGWVVEGDVEVVWADRAAAE